MSDFPSQVDVLIIGAGAAGLMCAAVAGQRGRSVLVVDHANKVGKKILMSGGGRCNFTNYYCAPENYYSANPHFCRINHKVIKNMLKCLINKQHIRPKWTVYSDPGIVTRIQGKKNNPIFLCQRENVPV